MNTTTLTMLESRLTAEINQLSGEGLHSVTVYVRDPWWRGDLRLIAMPGVRVTEPMHGLIFPRHTSDALFTGQEAMFIDDAKRSALLRHPVHGPLSELARRWPTLFGDFVEREEVKSCARFLIKNGTEVGAVVFFNFVRSRSFNDAIKDRLKEIVGWLENELPEVQVVLKGSAPIRVELLLDLQRAIDEFASRWVDRPEPAMLAEQVLGACKRSLSAEPARVLGTVFLLDPSSNLRLLASEGMDIKPPVYDIAKGEGIVSWVALRRRAILVRDYRESLFKDVWRNHYDDLVSQIAVPILVGPDLLGVLSFESDSTEAFKPDHVRMLWSTANQFGIATHLAEHSARYRRLLDAVSNLSSADAGATQPLNGLAGLCSSSIKADGCDVWQFDDAADRFRRLGEWGTGIGHSGGPRSDGWTRYVVRNGSIVWIGGIQDTKHFTCRSWVCETGEWKSKAVGVDAPKKLNHSVVDARLQYELGVPLRMGAKTVGVAWFKYRLPDLPVPSLDGLSAFATLAGVLSVAADSCRRNSAEILGEASSQVSEIQRLWRGLFPRPNDIPGIEVGVETRSVDSIAGGDFHAFDTEERQGWRLTFVVGDATGHGRVGALRMLPLLGAYRLACLHSASPAFRVERMRRVADILGVSGTALCVSLHVREKDGSEKERTFAASGCIVGHDPAIVFRKSHRNPVEKLMLPNLPSEYLGGTLHPKEVGAMPLVEQFLELQGGDVVVAYTDGVTDARDREREEGPRFERGGIERVVEEHLDDSAQAIAQRVLEEARRHAGGALDDDATVVVCRIKGR